MTSLWHDSHKLKYQNHDYPSAIVNKARTTTSKRFIENARSDRRSVIQGVALSLIAYLRRIVASRVEGISIFVSLSSLKYVRLRLCDARVERLGKLPPFGEASMKSYCASSVLFGTNNTVHYSAAFFPA